MDKQIKEQALYPLLKVFATIVALAFIWELGFEDWFFQTFLDMPEASDTTHWEHILTISAISFVALIYPFLTLCKQISHRNMAEKLTRESDQRLREISDNASASIFIKDMDGKYIFINNQFERTSQKTASQIIGKTDHEVFSKQVADQFTANDRQVFVSLNPINFEEVADFGNGVQLYLSTKFPLLNSEDQPHALCGISTDITKFREFDEQIRVMSLAMEQVNSSIVITDEKGDIEYVNPFFTQVTGYSLEEVKGKNPRVLKSGEIPPEGYKKLWETITGGETWRGEFHNKKKNGELYWESATISGIENKSGQIAHFIAIKEDITERRRIGQAFREQEQLTQTIFDNAYDAIISINEAGEISRWNKRAETIFGWEEEEVLGKPLQKLIIPERFGKAHLDGMRRFIETGVGKILNTVVEVPGRRKDGSEIPLELTLSAAKYKAGWIFTGIARDITERKKAEESLKKAERQLIASEKLSGVGRLAAGVSHEILNPLNIISLHVQMLQKGQKDNPALLGVLEKMRNEIGRIQKINKSLLTFARAGSVQEKMMDVHKEIQNILDLVRQDMTVSNVKLIENYVESPVEIMADPDELRQVFLNLINNARQAMPEGGKLTLATRIHKLNDQDHVGISLSDTGCGIPEGNLNKIFEPFFTTKPVGEGTGMGLSVCHTLVEKNGGTLRVESEKGQGATFIIDLPLAARQAPGGSSRN